MFDVLYSKQARKFILDADKILARRLLSKIEELQGGPILHDTKGIQGFKEKLYRVRVGDYRILYEVDFGARVIGIVKIDKRSRAY